MIDAVFIRNYKIFKKDTIRFDQNNIIIGENDSGKSSILEALDIFFNQEKIPNLLLIPDQDSDVEIGVLINHKMYKKTYSGKTKKVSFSQEVFNDFPEIKYVFLDSSTRDVSKLINDLSIAKSLDLIDDETKHKIEETMTKSAIDVISTIDPDLIVINGETTEFEVEPQLKIDSALKFKITSSGIPIEGRGSGFQKNVLYSLLTKGNYQNVVLGIDEIENSLSIRNSKELIDTINKKFMQTIITTHSTSILPVSKDSNIIPRYTNNLTTLTSLLNSLDSEQNFVFILVEGKYDVPWIKQILRCIDLDFPYVVLPSGGTNMNTLAIELERNGRKVVKIKDGDVKDNNSSLHKDIIEMYTPLDILNVTLGLTLQDYPKNKNEFFNATLDKDYSNMDTVKNQLSRKCHEFINKDFPLCIEVKNIILKQLTGGTK